MGVPVGVLVVMAVVVRVGVNTGQALVSVVTAPGASADVTSTAGPGSTSWVGFALGALVLALLIGAAFWIPRRRSAAAPSTWCCRHACRC